MSTPAVNAPNAARAASARPAQTASRAGNGSPEPGDPPFDPERPWVGRTPDSGTRRWHLPPSLRPLLLPQDPWPLAQRCGLLEGDDRADLRRVAASGQKSRSHTQEVADLLANHLHSRFAAGWKALSRRIEALEEPSLPPALARLLPPLALDLLEAAWWDCRTALLEDLWLETPEDPQTDWRMRAILPPFPAPAPAEVPPLPVELGPDLWMAWTSPAQGMLEPILLRAVGAPRALEAPEIRHGESGVLVVPTVVGTPLCLDQPSAAAIIRALFHRGGLWEDETEPTN